MAAVAYSDGTSRRIGSIDEGQLTAWTSPASMDSADTVTVPTVTGKTVRVASCVDTADGTHATATVSSFTVTIDAAGGTTNHAYTLVYYYE